MNKSKFITKIEKCIIIESKLQKLIHDLENHYTTSCLGDEIDIHELLDNGVDLLITA